VTLVVRACTRDDLERIASMAHWRDFAICQERLAGQEEGRCLHLVAWREDAYVGRGTLLWSSKYADVRERLPGVVEVNALHVQPTGEGIGSAVMSAAEAAAHQAGALILGLAVEPGNEGARRFYARLGFSDWGQGTVVDRYTETDQLGVPVRDHADECFYLTKAMTAGALGGAVGLRPMTRADLVLVDAWLRQPHVARWWLRPTTAEQELLKYRRRIEEPSRTTMLTVTVHGRAVGWCQWYRWEDYPAEAQAMDARPGEAGVDYAIGEPSAIGRGLGTALISALVREVRRCLGDVGLLVGPDAANEASQRILAKNGFQQVAVRPVVTEPSHDPVAIYRLSPGEC